MSEHVAQLNRRVGFSRFVFFRMSICMMDSRDVPTGFSEETVIQGAIAFVRQFPQREVASQS